MSKKTANSIASKTQKESGRADVTKGAVTMITGPLADDINRVITACTASKKGKKSRELETWDSDHAYWIFLSRQGLNRVFLRCFSVVNYRNMSQFRVNPAKYLTATDMLIVQAVTGVSVGEQWEILLNGYNYGKQG